MDDQATPHTYQQAAEALGIEAEVVRARLRRGPLTNDRRPTVLLSLAEIAPIRSGIQTDRPEAGPDSDPDFAGRPDERDRTISALEAEAVRGAKPVARVRLLLPRWLLV
jgi:hypothetical protein